MKIDSVYVKNFKSIEEVQIDFNSLNVLIGRNAAGKSNFLELFQFLKDIGEQGLEDAIQLRGGVDYFRNTRLGNSENFELECSFSEDEKWSKRTRYHVLETDQQEYLVSNVDITNYTLEIEFEDGEYKVVREVLENKQDVIERGDDHPIDKGKTEIDGYTLIDKIERDVQGELDKETSVDSGPEELSMLVKERFHSGLYEDFDVDTMESILSTVPHSRRPHLQSLHASTDLTIYDIDPVKIKQGTTLKGKKELENDGNNLPLVLKKIVTSSQEKEKFINLVSDLLPFIKDWQTDTLRDKSIFLKILEEFEDQDGEYLPANLISDGTINVIALVIILYFESKNIVMIEEPERNMHPALISKVVEMMEDVSDNTPKQIFTTSHNIELIKNVDLDDILLVTRNKEGFTEIERPAGNERIQTFLEEGMGLGELYVKNILDREL